MKRKSIKLGDWDTYHNEGTMYHVFSNGVTLTVNWEANTLALAQEKQTIDVFPFSATRYSIDFHERVLHRIASIANRNYLFTWLSRKIRVRNLKKVCHELRCM